MTEPQRDLSVIDQRGAAAGREVRRAAADVDAAAMFERIRAPRSVWAGPLVAVTAMAAVVAIVWLVAMPSPLSVGGLDPSGGGAAPTGLEGQKWPPDQGTAGPDGWVEVPREVVPTAEDPHDLMVVGGAFVLAAEDGHVWVSADGFAWAEVPGVGAAKGERLFLGQAGETLLVLTGSGAVFAGDVDGVDQVAALGQIHDVAGGPQGAVAIASRDEVGVVGTADGRTWEPVTGLDRPVRSVAWDGTRFVAVTDGPDAELLQADNATGPWTPHPGSATLPDGWWAVEPTEPGVVLVPRADGEQDLLPLWWWTEDERWASVPLPGQGPLVVHDVTTADDGALLAMAADSSLAELDTDRLYRIEHDVAQPAATVIETGEAFGPTAVVRRAHAVSDGTTAMVAHARRRAGPGDGLTVWVHRSVDAPGWWCPPAATDAAEVAATRGLELVSARLSTVGEVREWQSVTSEPSPDGVPQEEGQPQGWLESLPAGQPAIVCVFRAEEFMFPGGGYRYASFVVTPDGTVQPFRGLTEEPATRDHGPQSSTPVRGRPDPSLWEQTADRD